MRRFALATALAAVTVLVTATAALAPPKNEDELLKDELHRLEQSQTQFRGGQKSGSAMNIEVVGHHDIGGRGFNADVWAHEGFAYIGHWGFTDWASGSKNRFCPEEPDNGVAVIDYGTDPSNPVMVSKLQNPPGTTAEDVVVFTAEFGPFEGHDIAAAGLQFCGGSRHDPNALRGLMLWDVTDPANPLQIGFWRAACCTRGVHEFEVEHRADLGRTFAYATVPASEYSTSRRRAASGTRTVTATSA